MVSIGDTTLRRERGRDVTMVVTGSALSLSNKAHAHVERVVSLSMI
jgi:hypothetical protein